MTGRPARRLVVTADDFGLSPGVDRGIVEVAAAGVVTAVSTLVTLGRDLRPAMRSLRASGARAGLGLHFDCLAGRPLTRCPSLCDAAGAFLPLRALVLRALAGRVREREVERECLAQLESLAALGRVTHLDSHRHVHALPPLWAALARAAERARVRHVRVPLEPFGRPPRRPVALAKRLVLRLALARAGGALPPGESFAGIGLQGGRDVERRLLALLDALPEGTTELMMHPGYADDEARARDPYDWPRDAERAALLAPAVRRRLAQGDIALVGFGAPSGARRRRSTPVRAQ